MAQVKDPVCGMMLDPAEAAATSTYQGSTYYFCSNGDKEQFDRNPQRYLGAAASTRPRPEERPEA